MGKPGIRQSTWSLRVGHNGVSEQQNIHNVKFTILTIFKCTILCQQVHSHCCATISTTHPHNSFHKPETGPIRHQVQTLLQIPQISEITICPFVTGLFHSAQCLQGLSVLWHVLGFPFFLRLNNIPLQVYATFCLSIHLSMDTWIASTVWQL